MFLLNCSIRTTQQDAPLLLAVVPSDCNRGSGVHWKPSWLARNQRLWLDSSGILILNAEGLLAPHSHDDPSFSPHSGKVDSAVTGPRNLDRSDRSLFQKCQMTNRRSKSSQYLSLH